MTVIQCVALWLWHEHIGCRHRSRHYLIVSRAKWLPQHAPMGTPQAMQHAKHCHCGIALCTPCGHDPSPAHKPLDWVLLGGCSLHQGCQWFRCWPGNVVELIWVAQPMGRALQPLGRALQPLLAKRPGRGRGPNSVWPFCFFSPSCQFDQTLDSWNPAPTGHGFSCALREACQLTLSGPAWCPGA